MKRMCKVVTEAFTSNYIHQGSKVCIVANKKYLDLHFANKKGMYCIFSYIRNSIQ